MATTETTDDAALDGDTETDLGPDTDLPDLELSSGPASVPRSVVILGIGSGAMLLIGVLLLLTGRVVMVPPSIGLALIGFLITRSRIAAARPSGAGAGSGRSLRNSAIPKPSIRVIGHRLDI